MQITNLRSYLVQIGMPVREFAKKIACNRCYLSRLITGDAYASPRLAKDIFEATGGVIRMPTREDAEKKIKEETQYKALLNLKQGGAGNIPTFLAEDWTSFDEHKQD